jgi:hypothetical protein
MLSELTASPFVNTDDGHTNDGYEEDDTFEDEGFSPWQAKLDDLCPTFKAAGRTLVIEPSLF